MSWSIDWNVVDAKSVITLVIGVIVPSLLAFWGAKMSRAAFLELSMEFEEEPRQYHTAGGPTTTQIDISTYMAIITNKEKHEPKHWRWDIKIYKEGALIKRYLQSDLVKKDYNKENIEKRLPIEIITKGSPLAQEFTDLERIQFRVWYQNRFDIFTTHEVIQEYHRGNDGFESLGRSRRRNLHHLTEKRCEKAWKDG